MSKRLAAAMSLLFCASLSSAAAQSRCRVMDPTGTPLNVRTAPNGAVVGVLRNGVLVSIEDRTVDRNGKAWVYVSRLSDERPLGWVFREFIACF